MTAQFSSDSYNLPVPPIDWGKDENRSALEALFKQVGAIIPFDVGTFFLVEEAKAYAVYVEGAALPARAKSRQSGSPAAANLHTVIQKRMPLVIPDKQAYPGWVGFEHKTQLRSWIALPILRQGEVVAVITLEKEEADFYQPGHGVISGLISGLASTAYLNARRYLDASHSLAQERKLRSLMADLAGELDQAVIMQQSIRAALEMLGADAGLFALVNPQTSLLTFSYMVGLPLPRMEALPLSENGLFETIYSGEHSTLILNYGENTAALPEWKGLAAVLGAPVIAGAKRLGLILVFFKEKNDLTGILAGGLLETIAQQAGVVLLRAQQFAQEIQRSDELEALRMTLEDISTHLSLSVLLQSILERSVTLLLASRGEFGLYDPISQSLTIQASYDASGSVNGQAPVSTAEIMQQVVELRKPVILPASLTAPGNHPAAMLAVPLASADELLGVLCIIDQQPGRIFAQSELQLLNLLAQQAAVAVENARLYEDANRKAQEAETLRRAGSVVASALDRSEAIHHILDQLQRVVPHDGAAVMLLHNGSLEVLSSQGLLVSPDQKGQTIELNSHFPGTRVIETAHSQLISDLAAEYPELLEQAEYSGMRAWMGVPLQLQEKIIGMLALYRREPGSFSQNHIRLAAAFADHVAIAIENARLFENAQTLATMDPLTGCFNRRHFFEMAHREFERAHRYGLDLSMVMMDLDRFKSVNDTYGHAAGDLTLKTLVHACLESLREVDILARYGGEEFVFLLPNTNLVGAKQVAERLHQRIERLSIPLNGEQVRLTTSMGVATLNTHCSSLESLLQHADEALYKAKAAGRNQVKVWLPEDE